MLGKFPNLTLSGKRRREELGTSACLTADAGTQHPSGYSMQGLAQEKAGESSEQKKKCYLVSSSNKAFTGEQKWFGPLTKRSLPKKIHAQAHMFQVAAGRSVAAHLSLKRVTMQDRKLLREFVLLILRQWDEGRAARGPRLNKLQVQAKNVCVIKEDICFVDQIWASGRGGQCETEPLLRDGPDTAHSHTSSPSQAKFNKLHFGPRLPGKPCNAIQDGGLPSPWVIQRAGLSACPWPASRAREGCLRGVVWQQYEAFVRFLLDLSEDYPEFGSGGSLHHSWRLSRT
ncbi:hypothetical protein Anapl_14439 [Anas platyrhynchos]|uniref:Uncharacterized protein n=1 Tax=Anas platyrhynchos TaxID=8839 RepID=R0JS11_ANAPL|nr:hypothetical protein Anapl_14439 [Anas platyrhynchos]